MGQSSDQLLQVAASLQENPLGGLGFKRKRLRFVRELPDVYWIVQFQRGPPMRWSAMHGQFCMEWGIEVKGIGELAGYYRPREPCTGACTLRMRVGALADGHDHWWPSPKNDQQAVATAAALREILVHHEIPYLERFRDASSVCAWMEDVCAGRIHWQPPGNGPPAFGLELACLYHQLGETEKARARFAIEFDTDPTARFVPHLNAVRRRLGY